MAYATNTDISTRLGVSTYLQLTDDDNDGVADAAVVDEARLGAEGEVNAYLARRYQTPIDVVAHLELAGLLASITLDVVEYRLRLRRPPVPADTQQRFQRTVAWLEAVAAGAIGLPSLTELPGSSAVGVLAESSGEIRLLTRDELTGN
jgi:phage gp36-like protein